MTDKGGTMIQVKRALVSVHDKSGVVEFAEGRLETRGRRVHIKGPNLAKEAQYQHE